ncbi:MAG: putative glycolipid-binding domain-containing protein [Rhabdochlamydiaceae bacterium]
MIPLRSVFSKRVDQSGLDYCTLAKDEKNWQIKGTLITVAGKDDEPVKVDYSLICDLQWATREADISISRREGTPKSMKIIVDLSRRWWIQGREHGELRDCVDLDISLTPSTNTPPIKRLNLGIGDSREISASWLKFPEFVVERATQKYTRTGDRNYKYESGNFSAEIAVDELGLVTSNGNLWGRF